MAEMPEVWSQPVPRTLQLDYQSIDISRIKPSRYQARKDFSEQSIKTLAESIRQEGLLEPIVVRPLRDEATLYELVSGERRLRACTLLGMSAIDAKVINTVSEAEAAAKGLIENLQREDLNPVEEAEGFKALLELHDSHWTQEQIGKVVGKPQSRISESIRLLDLPHEVLENIRRRILTREHGVELLRLNNGNSIKSMAEKALKGEWLVKKTREEIDKKLNRGNGASKKGKRSMPGSAPTAPLPDGQTNDPLSSVWKDLLANPGLQNQVKWSVSYPSEETWTLTFHPNGGSYANFIWPWLMDMAKAMRAHTDSASKQVAAPVLAVPALTPDRHVLLNWEPVLGASAYQVLYGQTPDELSSMHKNPGYMTGTHFDITVGDPLRGQTRYFAVRALDAFEVPGPLSEVKKVEFPA